MIKKLFLAIYILLQTVAVVSAADFSQSGINIDECVLKTILEVEKDSGFYNTSYTSYVDAPEGCPAGDDAVCISADIQANVKTWAWQTWKTPEGINDGTYLLHYNFYAEGDNLQSDLLALKQGEKDNGKDGTVISLLSMDYDGDILAADEKTGIKCEKNKWYCVDLLMKFPEKSFDAYLDGNKIASDKKISRGSFTSLYFMAMNEIYIERSAKIYAAGIKLSRILPKPPTAVITNAKYIHEMISVPANAVPPASVTANIEFSIEMQSDSFKDNVTVTDDKGNIIPFSGSLSSDGVTYTLVFESALRFRRKYSIIFNENVLDIYDRGLGQPCVAEFETEQEGFAISEPKFLNELGEKTDTIPKEKLVVSIDVQNIVDRKNTVVLIAAVIKENGKVRTYSYMEREFENFSEGEVSTEIDTSGTEQNDCIQVFIWDGYDSMNPLKDTKTLKNIIQKESEE